MEELSRSVVRVMVVESQWAVAVREQGNLVRVRDRYWVVESVRQSSRPPMSGVLLYTASPDSEGNLGGLVAGLSTNG